MYLLTIIDGDEKYISAKHVNITDEELSKLINMSSDELTKLRDSTIDFIKETEKVKKEKEENEKLESENKRKKEEKYLSDKIRKISKYGVAIIDYRVFDISEHTEGTGFRIKYINLSKKPIKYVTASVVGLNGVNDPVKLFASSSSVAKVRLIGPIPPRDIGGAEYEYIWHTDIVQSAIIKKLLVEYMDGTKKEITNIKDILLNDFDRSIIESHIP